MNFLNNLKKRRALIRKAKKNKREMNLTTCPYRRLDLHRSACNAEYEADEIEHKYGGYNNPN